MINDPAAIKFVNEDLRPLCEELRALRAKVLDVQTRWFAGMDVEFSDGAAPVDDGREAEGVSRLTGADVTNAVVQLLDVVDVNTDVVTKPCVRPLSAN